MNRSGYLVCDFVCLFYLFLLLIRVVKAMGVNLCASRKFRECDLQTPLPSLLQVQQRSQSACGKLACPKAAKAFLAFRKAV